MALKDPQNYVLKPQREGGGIAGGSYSYSYYTLYINVFVLSSKIHTMIHFVSFIIRIGCPDASHQEYFYH